MLSLDYILSVASGVPPCGDDLAVFSDMVFNSRFYQYMLKRAKETGVDLTDPVKSELARVKTLVLQDVLAKRGNYPSAFERTFAGSFPTVYRAIRWINGRKSPPDGCRPGTEHGKLIRILQRLESALVVETVCPLLLDRIPVVPLYDCLYTRLSDIGLVEEAFHDAFDRCGVRLGLKRDVPCEQVGLN